MHACMLPASLILRIQVGHFDGLVVTLQLFNSAQTLADSARPRRHFAGQPEVCNSLTAVAVYVFP
jgi:hypothetical protein